jgi:hypothetical protein|tara:strand:+ start:169 stop:531 length:363 start_codon:yes stop_codon:yes gene_type:complete
MLVFLILCIFIQSCYTYKHIELNGIKENDKLKIRLKTTKLLKGEVISLNKELISLKSKKTNYKILKSSIKGIRKRESSKSKNTILGILVSIPVVYLIYDLLISGIKISGPDIGNSLKGIK